MNSVIDGITMEKVEVDPKLFVTCRLCLEDMGLYQIIPNIQHQIKYCFDIEVAPFDGLPQLICKKCELKLTEYFTIKTAYVAKQQLLINSLQNKNVNNVKTDISVLPKIAALVTSNAVEDPAEKDTDTVSDKTADFNVDTECKKENSPPVTHQKTLKRKRIRIESTSSSSSESKDSDGTKVKPLIIRKTKNDRRHKWQSINYSRHYSCRMCSKSYVKRHALFKHYSNIHTTCFKKFKSILNSFCTVNIEKVDNKPNFTGVNNAVVLSRDKVMVNDESSKYFIMYTKKSQKISNETKENVNESSDSSDDAEYSVSRKKRKKRLRLLSSDTVVTVVIDKKDDNENMSSGDEDRLNGRLINNKSENRSEIITEFINLDSDSEAESTMEIKNSDSVIEENENKLIRNVIEVCHNKYLRNIATEKNKKPNYANIESQLMHKVLNLGRKIVNRQGLNCTGLLRFLEHRNLRVIWLPKTGHSFSGPPVRISMTTMKGDHQRPEDSDAGWIEVPFNTNRIENILKETSFPLKETNKSVISKCRYDSNEILPIPNNSPTVKRLKHHYDNLFNISHEQVSTGQSITDQAHQYIYEDASCSGKLLNENPVANPKQLPKKTTPHYEMKQNRSILENDENLHMTSEMNGNEPLLCLESIEGNDLTGMPIITSTTSLASEYNQIATENKLTNCQAEAGNEQPVDSNITKSAASAPRIKVKPVSELMPENISTPNNLLLNQNNINTYDQSLPNITKIIQPILYQQKTQPVSVIQMPMTTVNNVLPEGKKNNSDYFILHTVEMPNTKTDSPFNYLKSLLRIHNIFLIEIIRPNDFHCLIKFKVLFKQEAVKPIILCLSLHCDSNRFNIGIKDSTNININMQDLSANWQWEIIKIFQGDVCNKITQTALRMGLDVHDNSKIFLCLVKSIQMKKIEV